jgi:hypothetical protein
MNVQTRGLLVLVTLLVGCGIQRDYTLGWPGVHASGLTLFGGPLRYSRIGWGSQLGVGPPPAFSVRLPGGRIIKPDEFTIAKLESHGATEWKPRSYSRPNRPLPGKGLTYRRIESGAGTLLASFDQQNQLQNISLTAHTGEGTVFVGDRNGRRMIPLPATREELVKLFGEPEHERAIQR